MLPSDLRAVAQIWFQRQGSTILGEREATLLDAIDASHSIKEAAKTAGISYRTAWACIQTMERSLGAPVVRSRAGGPGGGATTLTDDTRELLRLYSSVRTRVSENVGTEFRAATSRAL